MKRSDPALPDATLMPLRKVQRSTDKSTKLERRQYALLQATAVLYRAFPSNGTDMCPFHERVGERVDNALTVAQVILDRIEKDG
jgi:hypothetical protein